jgi:excisionase family DNA binding protein
MMPINLADLDSEALDKIPREQIPPLILMLLAKLLEPVPSPATDSSTPYRLITVDTAAERLAFTPQYLYDLIRKHQFPAIREGKYLRIRESDLSVWIDNHQEKALDSELYQSYSKQYGRQRTKTNQKLNGTYPGANGRKNRREGKHNCTLGTGRVDDIRTRLKVHSTPGNDGHTGQPEG